MTHAPQRFQLVKILAGPYLGRRTPRLLFKPPPPHVTLTASRRQVIIDVGRWGVRPSPGKKAAASSAARAAAARAAAASGSASLTSSASAGSATGSGTTTSPGGYAGRATARTPSRRALLVAFPSDSRLSALEVALVEAVGIFMDKASE